MQLSKMQVLARKKQNCRAIHQMMKYELQANYCLEMSALRFVAIRIWFTCHRHRRIAKRKPRFGRHFNRWWNIMIRQITPSKCRLSNALPFWLLFKCHARQRLAISQVLGATHFSRFQHKNSKSRKPSRYQVSRFNEWYHKPLEVIESLQSGLKS
jgi:hypothetical protein